MTLNLSASPHVRDRWTTSFIMHTVLLSLVPAAAVGVIVYGWHALFVILASILAAVATEALFCLASKKPLSISDGSAAVTGMLLALSLSPSTPVIYPIIGSVFAIFGVKCCFGGLGKNFINPALAGRCFLLISFGKAMTQFPSLDGVSSATPLAVLSDAMSNGTPANLNVTSMFLGTSNAIIGSSIVALLTAAHSLDSIGGLNRAWRAYASLPVEKKAVRRRFNHRAYRVYTLWHAHRLREATKEVEAQIRETPTDDEHVRLIINARLSKARLLFAQDLKAEALSELHTTEQIAGQYGLRDALLEIYELKTDILKSENKKLEANESYNRYLTLKDSLYISRQLSNIDEMQFGYDLKKKDEKLQTERTRRLQLLGLAVTLIVIALILLVMLLIIKRKNGKLRESNRQLYLKSIAQLKSEANERVVTHKYEQQISNLQQHIADDADSARQRYKGSGLSDDDKGQVLARIKKVMEEVDEYCSPDFSVLRLSSLAGYKPKDISEVIHEYYNCNFNAFLNEYRIREACRRVSEDEAFTRLTIQGMANSVGFKSRSAFIAAFKKFAGLTPSEYIKISVQTKAEEKQL